MSRGAALLAMVSDAVSKPSRTQEGVSGGVLGQHLMHLSTLPDITAQQARSGLFVTGTALRYTDGMSQSQRAKVLAAIVMATRGQVDAGLVEFTGSELESLSADALAVWALALAPDAYAAYEGRQASISTDLATCAQQIRALEQAAPKLYEVKADAPAEVVIRATGGDVTIKGITIKGDTLHSQHDGVNVLTFAQHEQIRHADSYRANIATGRFTLQDAQLVEAI